MGPAKVAGGAGLGRKGRGNMGSRHILALSAAAALCCALSVRAEPTTRPASATGRYIRAIRQAAGPRLAMSEYSRGCSIDPDNPELHDAFVRRMLQFGLPRLAYAASLKLIRLDARNGTAWGVIGYVHATRSNLVEALKATVQAAEHAPEGPSIIGNVAQLIAWYEVQPTPAKLPQRTRSGIQALKQHLGERKAFAVPYRRVKADWASHLARMEKSREQVDTLKSEIKDATQSCKDAKVKLTNLMEQILVHRHRIVRLKDRLRRLASDVVVDTPNTRELRIRLRNELRSRERDLAYAEETRRDLQKRAEELHEQQQRKAAELKKLSAALEAPSADAALEFHWSPPAVDGVVTPEVRHLPTQPATASAPRDAEALAHRRLQMAKLYLAHGMRDKAGEMLCEILREYSATRAAKEATALLLKLNAPAGGSER